MAVNVIIPTGEQMLKWRAERQCSTSKWSADFNMTQTGPSFQSSQCAETVRRPGGMGSIRPPTGFSLRGSLMYLRKPVYSIVEHIAPGFCQSPPGWRGDILYMLRLTPHRRLGTGRETRATRQKAHRRAPHPPYTLLISLSVCYKSEQP